MTLVLLAAASAEEEPAKAAFYIAGGVLVAFALIVSAVGIRSGGAASFPPSRAARNGLLGLCMLLVAATLATAVITA